MHSALCYIQWNIKTFEVIDSTSVEPDKSFTPTLNWTGDVGYQTGKSKIYMCNLQIKL